MKKLIESYILTKYPHAVFDVFINYGNFSEMQFYESFEDKRNNPEHIYSCLVHGNNINCAVITDDF